MRNFPDIINEWTDTLLELNRDASLEQVILITRLGPLGQRLIYEANAVGMAEVVKIAKGRPATQSKGSEVVTGSAGRA